MASGRQLNFRWRVILFLLLFFVSTYVISMNLPSSDRAEKARTLVEKDLREAFSKQGLSYGAPIFVRIFKHSSILELWVQASKGKFKLFRTYDICAFSGELGPKLKEGDKQSPEGFYFVNAHRLNPNSRFHLSFNIGYPNQYDRYHGRTGSALMVHGNCVSIGCYAMTDKYINEIYTLAAAALHHGQAFFRVHIFPFPLTNENLDAYKDHDWYDFWLNLKGGYDYFNAHGTPPNVEVSEGVYIFNDA